MATPTYEELVGTKPKIPTYEELTGKGVPSYEELTKGRTVVSQNVIDAARPGGESIGGVTSPGFAPPEDAPLAPLNTRDFLAKALVGSTDVAVTQENLGGEKSNLSGPELAKEFLNQTMEPGGGFGTGIELLPAAMHSPELPPDASLARRVAAIGQNVVAGLAGFALSPAGVMLPAASAAAPELGTLIGAGFAAQGLKDLPAAAREIFTAETPQQRDAAIERGLVDGLMLLPGIHLGSRRATISDGRSLATIPDDRFQKIAVSKSFIKALDPSSRELFANEIARRNELTARTPSTAPATEAAAQELSPAPATSPTTEGAAASETNTGTSELFRQAQREASLTPATDAAVAQTPIPKTEPAQIGSQPVVEGDAIKSEPETQGGISAGSPLLPNATPFESVLPVKAMSEIIRDIAKGIDIPIRFGRLTTSKFAGYFKKVQNLIGAKTANDIGIVSHEVGHKLDEKFGISKMPFLRAELDVLGDPSTPGSRSSWTISKNLKYKHGEGMAEFVRHWLTDPAKAAKDAPLTNRFFEGVMDSNPDFGDVMRQAREDVRNWRNAPAEARLDSSISVGDNPNKTRYRLPQLTRDLVDDLHMLKLAVEDASKSGTTLAPSENPYLLARLLRGSYGMADTFIRNGVVDFKTRGVTLGNSFEDALKPVAGRINDFRRWIVAKRAQELHTQGRETGLVPSDVDAVATKYASDPAFVDAFNKLKIWQDDLLQYAVDSGYVSDKSAAAMREMNHDYVPFHRIFEIGAGESPSQTGGGTGRGLNVGKAGSLKRLTGSTRDIVDPLETMIKNAYVIITASEKSAINKAIGELSGKADMGKWVERVAAPKEAVKVELEKIRAELEANGADLSAVPDDLVMQFFQNSGRAPWGENIIKVTSGGDTKFYRLRSELFDAFHSLDMEDSSRLVQVLSQPAQLLRAGVTLDPAFGLANVMRDAVGSAVINRYGMLPFEASARGAAAMLKNPKLVAEWAASGGEQSFEASFFDRKKMAKFMRERITKDMTKAEQALVILKSPLTALRYISGAAESATRIGEFERSYKEAIKSGMEEGDARRLASFESRDRQDFAKGGAKTKILRHAAAFWNAGLQGNVAVAKAFKERPVRTTLQGLAYITGPTLLAMALNHDNPDYWDRPQWERDAFWLIPIGKDDNQHASFLRIPKPFLLGVMFGAVPERIMAFARAKDPAAFKDTMTRIIQEIVPNPMPQMAQVVISDFLTGKQGWDMWRDRPVVPESLADLPPELQATEQTSLSAKKVGSALGMSPMKVDHIIAGLTGGLGRQVTHNIIDQAIGAFTGEKPTARRVVPGMRFVTTPAGISSQAVETFYERLSKLREQKAAEKMTKKKMPPEAEQKRLSMEDISDRMAKLRGEARKATSPEEKQRKYLEISRLAIEALK